MFGIELNRASEIPLARQIYQSLSDGILGGRIPAGEALPSTRELARQMGISRNTVNEAYEMLLAEGFVISRQGAATRVADGLRLEKTSVQKTAGPVKKAPPYLADFRTGQPDLRCFPRYQWNRLMHSAADLLGPEQFGYSGPEGLPRLRAEIAAWLTRSRGLAVDPQAIFITAGATHALHLLADLLGAAGREILIEDPCHIGMLRALQGKGYPVRPVPVDQQGLRTDDLPGKDAGAVYVTPSHQFPLGGILPAERRAALVRFARENDLYIVEDDYDSEFRYCGAPVAPLHAIDPQRVIYVGTFSKILFPALRIGYAILPAPLHNRWRDLRTHNDVQNPPFEQAALAEWLHSRKLDRHIWKMRRAYGQRRQALLQALASEFGTGWRAWGDSAGLHIAVEFPGMIFGPEFIEACQKHGVRAVPVEHHSIRKSVHLDKLLLGYGHLEPAEIQAGVVLLRKAMDRLTDESQGSPYPGSRLKEEKMQ